jgi:hypothetical protein
VSRDGRTAAELLAPADRLDEVGLRIVVTHLALDHPGLLDEILDRVPVVNGGRWDRCRVRAGAQQCVIGAGHPDPHMDVWGTLFDEVPAAAAEQPA